MEAAVIISVLTASALFLVIGAVIDDARARRERLAPRRRVELPLLHSVNDDRCIGCEACVDACPTNVLDIIDHKVNVARFSDCVQCEQCANACPTTALVMFRQGEQPRTLTVPELDDHFQTGVPGQYLIGEVAGKPLVKNAANLGRAVVEHIRHDLAQRPAAPQGVVDIVIVGSGPGGLSAGLAAFKYKLSCVVLEKDHVISSTVSRYPKGKHFMAEPSNAPNLSFLPVFDASKEALVAAWKKVADGVNLPIKLGEAVESVKRGDDGVFEVKTTIATYRGRSVILATGLRGKPRLLAVPGANLEKVQSRLEDAAEFGGQHVLVVGGGDSALEAALSLNDEGARVTLSYRGGDFKRAKQANQKKIADATASRTIDVLLESNVKEFTPDQVAIKLKDGSVRTIANQAAFVLIGADTPVAWLENLGVRFVEREHLYALGLTEDLVRRVAPDAEQCPRDADAALANLLGRPQRLRTRVGEALHDVSVVMKLPVAAAAHRAADAVRHKRPATARPVGNDTRPQPAAHDARPSRPAGYQTRPVPAIGYDTRPLTAIGRDTLPQSAIGRDTIPVPSLRGGRDSGSPTIPRPIGPQPVRTTAMTPKPGVWDDAATVTDGVPATLAKGTDNLRQRSTWDTSDAEGGKALLARPFSENELDDAFGNLGAAPAPRATPPATRATPAPRAPVPAPRATAPTAERPRAAADEFDDAPTQASASPFGVDPRRRPVRSSPPPPTPAVRPLPGLGPTVATPPAQPQPRAVKPSTPPPVPTARAAAK